ncbi:uncharacterized protein LOC131858206 [Cryptomeria japonica]|uniref:uncharacterized protein LOC131858206 n=1 Tax=Cryptomeria japonica TaxID=3369 RepID=UPI0027DA1B91|nr:uncharacterized protein LOC131858206 [Cryptomeria japonica]
MQPINDPEKEDKIQSFGKPRRDEVIGIHKDHKVEEDAIMGQLLGDSKDSPCIMASYPLVDDYRVDKASVGSAIFEAHKGGILIPSYLQGMTALGGSGFPCFVHMIALEEHLMILYVAYGIEELITKTKRSPNEKILQFDNVWFVMSPTPWSWLELENRTAMEIEAWIRLWAAKAAKRT